MSTNRLTFGLPGIKQSYSVQNKNKVAKQKIVRNKKRGNETLSSESSPYIRYTTKSEIMFIHLLRLTSREICFNSVVDVTEWRVIQFRGTRIHLLPEDIQRWRWPKVKQEKD